MKKSTKNKLIVGGILTVATAVVGTAAVLSRLLFNIAVKRDTVKVPDKIQDKLSGGLKSDPRVKSMFEAGADAENLETETVRITSHDGLTLTGHIYPCDNVKRIVIAMHGWRSSWTVDYGCTLKFYHDSGCLMLLPDQRGQNDSGGDYIGFGVLERNDCFEWVKYVCEKYGDTTPVYLCGVSMGATTVLMTSGFKLPDCVKGIIADCGFTSPHEIWKHVLSNNLHIHEKLAYPIVNAICKREAQFDGDEYSTIDALKVNTKPVLFIHGSDDSFVPLNMTFENYLACSAPKELLIVPGAGHGMSYVTDKNAYTNAITGFFEKCETPATGKTSEM